MASNEQVLQEIRELRHDFNDFKVEMTREVTALKIKSGVWGFAAGALPTLILIGAYIVKQYLSK
ncbi:MAG: hypothetical protein ACE5I1_21695 [bacterium]